MIPVQIPKRTAIQPVIEPHSIMDSIANQLRVEYLPAFLAQATQLLDGKTNLGQRQRQELTQASQKLTGRLQSPARRIEDLTYVWTELGAIKIAIDIGLFDMVIQSEESLAVAEIAEGLDVDALLVERVMRSLKVSGLFTVTGDNRYRADPCINEFASGGPMNDRITVACDIVHPAGLRLPAYLSRTNYQSPSTPSSGPFQYAFQTEDHCFTWLQKHPVQQAAFNGLMQSTIENSQYRWFEIFPATTRFQRFRGPAASEPLCFVDVGGGIGHDLLGLFKQIPDLHARIVLQDSAPVLEQVLGELLAPHLTQSVQPMPHDIFNPQPVRNAHYYFLGRVLHTFPNEQCQTILRHICAAMSEDSILLIHDRVVPETVDELRPQDTATDFIMMILHSAMERSESQFGGLLADVGLRLVRVWKMEGRVGSTQRVLEVVRDG